MDNFDPFELVLDVCNAENTTRNMDSVSSFGENGSNEAPPPVAEMKGKFQQMKN